MVLRLDPAIPLVWRDLHTLQFGVDPAIAVLERMTRGQERLVAALTKGVTTTGLRMLAAEGEVSARQRDELLARLTPCLLSSGQPTVRSAGQAAGASARGAIVLGSGPLALGLARLLEEAGLRPREAPRRPGLVVLVADRVLAPADHRTWLQRDIPHLPVVVGDTSVTVGPLVVPGASACLHCAFLHRRDADAAWPAIAAQLATLPAPAPHPLRTATAVALAGRVVDAFLGSVTDGGVADGSSSGSDGSSGDRTNIGEPGRAARGRVWPIQHQVDRDSARLVPPHPVGRGAAPPVRDWAPGYASATPRPTSAARASAGRA
jgi:hypothetical protein